MIVIGSRWSLRWRYPHRIEAVIMMLEADYIVCDTLHRCGFGCELSHMKSLGLSGEMKYGYADFHTLFQPMAVDAIALA